MPSYPTSVWAPTTKAAGNTIQAADVNDAQDEIVAIEGGIRNGTAPLNSSVSTVAALSVTGGSTFAGPAVFSSAVTFGANGSITLPRSPACRVTHDAVQEIAADAWAGLSWNTEDFDSTTLHSTATNSSRITLNSSGVWMIGAYVQWTGNSTGTRRTRLRLSDTTTIMAAHGSSEGHDPYTQLCVTPWLVSDTVSYVTVQVYPQASTARINASGSTNEGSPAFWAYRVSP